MNNNDVTTAAAAMRYMSNFEEVAEMDETTAPDDIVDSTVEIEAALWAGYLYVKYSKNGNKLAARLFATSKMFIKTNMMKALALVKSSTLGSKIFRTIFKSGTGRATTAATTAAIVKLEKAMPPAIRYHQSLPKLATSRIPTRTAVGFGTRMLQKGKGLLGKASKFLPGALKYIGYAADLYITYDLAQRLYDKHIGSDEPNDANVAAYHSNAEEAWDRMLDAPESFVENVEPRIDRITSLNISRNVGQTAAAMMMNQPLDANEVIQHFMFLLDKLPSYLDDEATTARVTAVIRAAAGAIDNNIGFAIIPSRVVAIDLEAEKSYLADGQKKFEMSRSFSDALNIEMASYAMPTVISQGEVEGIDANDTILNAFGKGLFTVGDIRLTNY